MPWYTAHAIMYVRFKRARQDHFPVWENMILVRATDNADAWDKATALAKRDEGDADGTMRWGRRQATMVFAGLRKVVRFSHAGKEDRPRHGDEATYSEYVVADEKALRALAAGKACDLRYLD